MNSIEQLEDDETGKALVKAAYMAIDRQHVKGYAQLAFSKPEELTEKVRRGCMESLFAFANLGWSAFHLMNKGEPLKDRAKAKRRPAKKTKKKAT